ncbi:hypothetical protein K1T71_002062 [Dendrolimus kikuchii]|uniref:Uncharacterized protein n=1 Tax=Dendrolimus kikuchii TaxID=765133 RepID=A0ACC1DFI8_9NEOP|nr:hypothetical protein K1T71_002062 [Dendrolimus kikuchii]
MVFYFVSLFPFTMYSASGASRAAGVGSSADGLDASKTRGADGIDVEAERRKREAEEERKKQDENAALGDDDERRRRREEEERRLLEAERRKRAAKGSEFDAEREQCMAILHTQLRARGGDTLYKQPNTELSHAQASEWLQKPPMKVDKSVKESADTARLSKKFERKLHALVSKVTPEEQYDTMQDYKTLVRDVLISEMQKRGNEILIEVDGAAETFFFAAQRLKKTKTLETKEPCNQVAYYVTKKLEDMIRCRSMARKLTATMKDHIKDAADYLSELVTKPDEYIEAYVSLLGEMEAAGDSLLIEGDISKSYKDAAA